MVLSSFERSVWLHQRGDKELQTVSLGTGRAGGSGERRRFSIFIALLDYRELLGLESREN